MVETKSLEQSSKNWDDAIGRVPGKYSDGIKSANNWQENAIAAEDLWAQKIQEAAASKIRARRIAETSNEEWKKAALEKGAARIGTGMAASKDKFRSGIGKVLDVLHGVNLPPRVADVNANIDNRVKPIAEALHRMKE